MTLKPQIRAGAWAENVFSYNERVQRQLKRGQPLGRRLDRDCTHRRRLEKSNRFPLGREDELFVCIQVSVAANGSDFGNVGG